MQGSTTHVETQQRRISSRHLQGDYILPPIVPVFIQINHVGLAPKATAHKRCTYRRETIILR